MTSGHPINYSTETTVEREYRVDAQLNICATFRDKIVSYSCFMNHRICYITLVNDFH